MGLRLLRGSLRFVVGACFKKHSVSLEFDKIPFEEISLKPVLNQAPTFLQPVGSSTASFKQSGNLT